MEEARTGGLPSAALEALDEATRGIAEVLDVERVLQLIVDRVRDLVGSEYAALGIVDQGGQIERFITSGISPEARTAIGPPPRGHGLLGLIIRERRSYRIPDIAAHGDSSGFPPNHPPMTSFLGVPVTVRGRSVGNLYLTDKLGADEFAAGDQRLVEMFAAHAAIAIENARLHQQVQRLAIVEERDRIGKDLHDGIIQGLYAVSLSLEDVPELMAEDAAEATARVDGAIEAVNRSIRDIRKFILGLQSEVLDGAHLEAALATIAHEIRLNTLIEVDVAIDEASEPGASLDEATRGELLQIARELLSNVARHSGAGRATVELRQVDDRVRLAVSDNGRGFDPDAELPSGHMGLANLRRRAAALDAEFRVESRAGSGTRIIVVVPVRTGPGAGSGARPEDSPGADGEDRP